MLVYGALVFIGQFFINGVLADCLVQYNDHTTGTGILNATFNSTPYCAYYGVRYGEPPVGKLRFRHTVLHEPSGHQNYTSPGSMCAQYNDPSVWDYPIGKEDCLFANIYTPRVNGSLEKTMYPVLVYVHGGSYVVGHGEKDINGADLLIDSGLVVVTFNYRLNMFGFFKASKYNISGNYGLKDQTTLLRWVQRYIGNFGGDPKQVTLLGQSAGAGSVTHHLYIPQSKDLFHRMIALSGSFLASWSFMYLTKYCSEEILSDFQAYTEEEFRSLHMEDFYVSNSTNSYAIAFASMTSTCFIPMQEKEEVHNDNYTVNAPHESVLKAPVTKVPIMLSETAREVENILQHTKTFLFTPNIPQNWTTADLYEFIESVENFTARLVEEGYANSTAEVVQQMAAIANIYYPMRWLAHKLSETLDPTTPVYYFRFEYDGQFGGGSYLNGKNVTNRPYGAIHGDDLGYIFSPLILKQALEDEEKYRAEWRVHRETVELVVNFIKQGNPTPSPIGLSNITWPPLNGNGSANTYLNIDKTMELRKFEENRIYTYWKEVCSCLYYNSCDQV